MFDTGITVFHQEFQFTCGTVAQPFSCYRVGEFTSGSSFNSNNMISCYNGAGQGCVMYGIYATQAAYPMGYPDSGDPCNGTRDGHGKFGRRKNLWSR